ncbi:MAG: hypothetical protein JXA00_06305 [Candidatus Thermoplasmatota archaeon]|nr:hypothetical protein [Candidatus Thermoplasmatota archaeon]
MKSRVAFFSLVCVLVCCLAVQSAAAADKVVVDFYYSSSCGSCRIPHENVDAVVEYYFGNGTTPHLFINLKEVGSNVTNRQEMSSRGLSYPSVIINNETRIPRNNITIGNLIRIIDAYLANVTVDEPYDLMVVDIPFFGKVNLSQLSLPVMTLVMATLDSFNPCSFFVLIFLMNLLLYMQSRRRMALVGGVFIFFSGLFYFLFMFILANTLFVTATHIAVVSVIAGLIALSIGVLNIKDFLFVKKGPSLSIPEKKRPTIFKKMRDLVHTTYLPAILTGTLFLAATVNFYELLCTFGFPFVFTTTLAAYQLPLFDYYVYIFVYNMVYVIPLIVIVGLFIVTLGKMKLTQWQGQKLKLMSGLMMCSFGVLFLVNYQLLEEFFTPIILLVLSVGLTAGISFVWEKQLKKDS